MQNNIQRKKEDPVQLFKNPVMERLTLLSFPVFLAVWLPCLAIVLFYAERSSVSALLFTFYVMIGFVAWFPVEYLLHRFLFHFQTRYAPVQSLIYMLHGNHHEQPNHPLRNLMPLCVTLPLAAVIWFGCAFFMGKGNGGALAAGFFCGYVFYDVTHYSCHQFRMRGRFLSRLKSHHINHHYRDHNMNYGITNTIIDRFFCTTFSSYQKNNK